MRITKITEIMPRVYAHVCPLCGQVYASSSEVDMMPAFSICGCDKNGNKMPVYELYENHGRTMIRRNKSPRFAGEVTMGQLSDIENVEWLDKCSVEEAATAMRKASEYLIKVSRYGR